MSHICPQCFAKLDLLTDEAAAQLIAEQERRAGDPAWDAARKDDDERFKEQSFGACLGIAGTMLALAIVSIVLISVARHHGVHGAAAIGGVSAADTGISRAALPPRFDEMVPRQVDGVRRTAADADLALPGTTIRIDHGSYAGAEQIFALDKALPSDDQAAMLDLAAGAAARQHDPPLLEQHITTQSGYEIVLAPSAPRLTAFSTALIQQIAAE